MVAARQFSPVAFSAALAILLVACGDGATNPAPPEPGVHVVIGAAVTDTIDARLVQALIVEVRGPDGALAHGAVVRFESEPSADTTRRSESGVYVCALTAPTCGRSGVSGGTDVLSLFATDTTDAEGRAKAIVRLGQVAGPAMIRVTAPEFGAVDSAVFTVTPGAAVRVRALAADTALDIGATATLRGRVVDRYENTRAEVPTLDAGPGTAIAVDAAAGTVTGQAMGTQWLFTRSAGLFDSTSVRVLPTGRIVVWSPGSDIVRLVNLNGTGGSLTVATGVDSDFGTFPRFDATRQRVTLHYGSAAGGVPNKVLVVDTAGGAPREIGASVGFRIIVATRQLADGAVLVVGRHSTDAPTASFSLWRVGVDDALTSLAALPGGVPAYGAADISLDGTRVAYVATLPSSSTVELRVLDVATGALTVLERGGRSPRWSAQGDRVAYLVPVNGADPGLEGVAVVINADGTSRRALGSTVLNSGLGWSPDGAYLIGRRSAYLPGPGLQLLRVADGAEVMLRFRLANGGSADYYQPDWR